MNQVIIKAQFKIISMKEEEERMRFVCLKLKQRILTKTKDLLKGKTQRYIWKKKGKK